MSREKAFECDPQQPYLNFSKLHWKAEGRRDAGRISTKNPFRCQRLQLCLVYTLKTILMHLCANKLKDNGLRIKHGFSQSLLGCAAVLLLLDILSNLNVYLAYTMAEGGQPDKSVCYCPRRDWYKLTDPEEMEILTGPSERLETRTWNREHATASAFSVWAARPINKLVRWTQTEQ